jgi:uncharacterized protein
MKNPKFVLKTGKNKQIYFHLTAKNGEPILSSEGYKSKSGAKNGIKSVMTNAPDDGQFKRKVAKNGKNYFNLIAKNNQVIGSSEMYESSKAMENGIKSVAKNAPIAGVEDTTN